MKLIAYKGFSKDWQCNGFQYAVGKSYRHDGDIKLCSSGFHACESPLDIWSYYPPFDGNVAAQVEMDGVSTEKGDDTKRVGKSITVKASLSIPALIAAQIEWTFNEVKKSKKVKGEGKAVASSGHSSTAASSGNYSKAASSGDYSTAASSGDSSKAASSGDYSTAASSGDSSKAASSGNYSKAASSGNYSTAASSGHSSTAASSGDSSKAASSGDYSTAASSGNYSKAASSGDYSTAASSGDSSKAACDTNGFACVAGLAGYVKGKAGSALSLGYRDAQGRNRIAVGYVGENGIEAGKWYGANERGELVAA